MSKIINYSDIKKVTLIIETKKEKFIFTPSTDNEFFTELNKELFELLLRTHNLKKEIKND